MILLLFLFETDMMGKIFGFSNIQLLTIRLEESDQYSQLYRLRGVEFVHTPQRAPDLYLVPCIHTSEEWQGRKLTFEEYPCSLYGMVKAQTTFCGSL